MVRRVGPYTIERKLGAGGMGVVYAGHMHDPAGEATPVAIKTMGPHLFADAKARAQFLREARIAQRVRHPNVVGTVDLREEEGQLWLVMEYVDGVALNDVLRATAGHERIPVAIALRILCDALRGIAGAYAARNDDGTPLLIVHRDVSPHNILVGRSDGLARVLDFGIAKTATFKTATDEVGFRGKIRYVAPEQIRGASASHRSDIYSAGVVAWEMLAGRALYDGESAAIIGARVLLGEVASLGVENHELPQDVVEIVDAMIASDPGERPSDAGELASRLEAAAPLATRDEMRAWVDAWYERVRASSAAEPESDDGSTVSDPLRARAPIATGPLAESPAPFRRSRARRWSAAIALAAVATTGVAAAIVFARVRRREPEATTASSASATPSESAASAESSAPDDRPEAAGAASVATTGSPQSTEAKKVAPRRIAPTQHPAATRSPTCRTLTYLDDKGIQRVRPECLSPR